MSRKHHLGQLSLKRLSGVHSDLVRVVVRGLQLCRCDFRVAEGVRTIKRQTMLVERGKSWTMNSRHLSGHAVDLWPMDLNWDPSHKGWAQVAKAIKRAADDLRVQVEWGVDKWGKDSPHFQLPTDIYPA